MNKTLFGLALLSYNWDNYQKDIVDCYIPLVSNIIINKAYDKVNREIIQNDLNDIYGINTPLGAVETILKRMTKQTLLQKTQGEFFVEYSKVLTITKKSQKDELNIAFNTLINDLQSYSAEKFGLQLTNSEIETGLITFFKENDLDLLFASDTTSVLPVVKESKKVKYIIAKFITDLQSDNPKDFSVVLKLARGYSIASLITYEDIQNYSGNLNDVQVFLDAPIVFNLLGLNGESGLKLSQELISTLQQNGASLNVFEINYEEVINTIQDAIKRLTTKQYDIHRSSRILRTAIRENISAQQLQIILNQVDIMLNQLNINKLQSPSLTQYQYQFQIDELKLKRIIEDLYRKENNHVIPWYKVQQIEKDVESISNIFKLRKRNYATSLKTSRALLLTSNEFIAFASKKFERKEWPFKSSIPVCITDIFLSTILWSNYPNKNNNLNYKQLISECYSIIDLDNRLLNKFYDDIEKMHEANSITNEQFYLLSSSNLTYILLEQKTFNDLEEYTDKTPNEILEDIQFRLNSEVTIEKNKLTRIDNNILRLCKFIARITFIIVVAILIISSFILKGINPKLDKDWFDILIWSVSGLIGIFGFLRWFEIIPSKNNIENKIENFLFRKIRNLLNKD